MNHPAASCGISKDHYDVTLNSSPPNASIGGPVRVSPGFPPFETPQGRDIVERLKPCGNDGL